MFSSIKMKKLLKWSIAFTIFLSIWLALITEKLQCAFVTANQHLVLFLPLIILFLFGAYSATVVFYRVFNFNNCEADAIELQKEIEEAKKDLNSRGIKLK